LALPLTALWYASVDDNDLATRAAPALRLAERDARVLVNALVAVAAGAEQTPAPSVLATGRGSTGSAAQAAVAEVARRTEAPVARAGDPPAGGAVVQVQPTAALDVSGTEPASTDGAAASREPASEAPAASSEGSAPSAAVELTPPSPAVAAPLNVASAALVVQTPAARPGASAIVPPVPAAPAAPAAGLNVGFAVLPAPQVHVVAAGDTLSAIAERYNTTVTEILRVNNLVDPNRLAVGDRLSIPR
jgi:LysM repeat protein